MPSRADDVAGMAQVRARDRAVGRRPRDRVHAKSDAGVLRRVDQLPGLVPVRGVLAAGSFSTIHSIAHLAQNSFARPLPRR